jgi:hypothetical protein
MLPKIGLKKTKYRSTDLQQSFAPNSSPSEMQVLKNKINSSPLLQNKCANFICWAQNKIYKDPEFELNQDELSRFLAFINSNIEYENENDKIKIEDLLKMMGLTVYTHQYFKQVYTRSAEDFLRDIKCHKPSKDIKEVRKNILSSVSEDNFINIVEIFMENLEDKSEILRLSGEMKYNKAVDFIVDIRRK